MGVPFARRRVLAALLATAALCAAVALPATALAATKFSSRTPASTSSSTQTKPKVSVYITDTYGIKGSSYFSMKIDGRTVKPKITYRKSRDYKHVTVSFQVTSALTVGSHVVVVKTKNVRRKSAVCAWRFSVLALPTPPPAPMPITVLATDCGACHAGYPAAHPMTACGACHGTSAPLGAPEYTSSSASAHTASCLLSDCHGHGWSAGPYPHTIGTDCSRCHNSAYANVPQGHSVDAEPAHISSSTRCTTSGCHLESLTMEHYRRSVGGAGFTCATCHSSQDPLIAAAIDSGSTACSGCHGLTTTHVVDAASHTLPAAPACTGAGCHTGAASVVSIHAPKGGCPLCHSRGRAPTFDCASCHDAGGHPAHPASPAPARIVIGGVDLGVHACAECHPDSDLRSLHGGTAGCSGCHAGTVADSATPWSGGCVQGQCHSAGPAAMHGSVDAAHLAASPPSCTVSGCHSGGRNVAAIHGAARCSVCHAPGAPLTIVCATAGCHAAGAPGTHAAHPASVTSATVSINGAGYGKHLCAECHATTELQAVHGGLTSCAKCHPAPRSSFAKWSGGCVQGSCHASGPHAMHGTIDASHTVATAPSCTAPGCHAGGSDVAAIHKDSGGCPVCHAVGRTATLVCATAGCHSAATTGNHAAHPATVTSGTITINSIGYGTHQCSECHATTELQAAHGGRSGCSNCHPAPRDSVPTWKGGCVQGQCHRAGTALAMHGALDTGHTATAAGVCTVAGCHTGGRDVAAVHAALSGRTDSGCRICHGVGVTPALTCATTGCHPTGPPASHDAHPAKVTTSTLSVLGTSYGTHACSECHMTTELQAVHGGTTKCASCHPSPRSSFTTWSGGCVQGACHKSGTALAMHGSIDTSHTAPSSGCITTGCHGSNVAVLHAPGRGCAVCHAPGVRATLTCSAAACHTIDPHPAHPSRVSTMTFTIAGAPFGIHACSECHLPADLRDLHGGVTGCSRCHPSPRNTFTKWNATCVQGGCHAPAGTASMHKTIDAGHTAPAGGCIATGCHVANIATLHAPGTGCRTCHKAGTALTKVCSASGCHATGASGRHASHPATITSATISINGAGYGSQLCSKCHLTTELIAAHGGTTSCTKCHPSPRSSLATWSGTCIQGDCHKVGTARAVHGAIDSSHNAATSPSCSVAGCHPGGRDAAAIHAAAGRSDRGCGVCHTTGKTPTLVCSSTGCHPGGASAKHTSHPASITSATISINGIGYGSRSCSTCHSSTELFAAHGGTSSCSKCHPAPRSSFTTWNGTCIQGDCHKAGTSLAVHGTIDSSHIAAAAAACTISGCHAGGSDIAAIHASGSGCATCHGVGRKATSDCSTSGCHSTNVMAKHDSHPSSALPTTITINGAGYGKHACTECHVSTELQIVHGGDASCPKCHPTPRSSFTTWNGTCVQGECHKAGTTRAYHGALNASHTLGSVPSCTSSCHTGGADVARIHALKGGCAACHRVGVTPTRECSTCHSGDLVAVHAQYIGTKHTVTAGGCVTTKCHVSGDAALLHEPGNGCADCHGGTTVPSLVCSDCHAGTATTVHAAVIGTRHSVPAGGPCVNSRCHTSADAATIHAPSIDCAACHSSGKPSLNCKMCHHSDAISSKHPSGSTAHTVNQHPCTSANCHGGNAATTHARSDSSCTACHSATTGVATTNACARCHDYGWAAYHAVYAVTSDYHGARVGTGFTSGGYESNGTILAPYKRGDSMPCSTCHVLAGTFNLHNFPAVVNGRSVSVTTGTQLGNLCLACHGGTVDDWHAGCFGCHEGGMGDGPSTLVGSDCSDCHTHGGWGWAHGRFWVNESTL